MAVCPPCVRRAKTKLNSNPSRTTAASEGARTQPPEGPVSHFHELADSATSALSALSPPGPHVPPRGGLSQLQVGPTTPACARLARPDLVPATRALQAHLPPSVSPAPGVQPMSGRWLNVETTGRVPGHVWTLLSVQLNSRSGPD